jgi:hypothetical protein
MKEIEIRTRIIEYLERREGDILRSAGNVADAVEADREVVQKLIRDMVKKGEVFEPIPRRYLRRERRVSGEHMPPRDPERRKSAHAGSRG